MITCSFYKQIISSALDKDPLTLPEGAQEHVRHCPSCRQFYEHQRDLAGRLMANAESHLQTPSPFLHGKIMASLDRAVQPSLPVRKVPHAIWAAAMILLGLGLFSLVLIRTGQNNHQQTARIEPSDPRPTMELPSTNVSTGLGGKVFEWSKALDQPLEAEMKSVVSDAKSAIHLLAQNFLPEPSEQTPR
jgi:predicted anti-sigma-YlaC factor YlaD